MSHSNIVLGKLIREIRSQLAEAHAQGDLLAVGHHRLARPEADELVPDQERLVGRGPAHHLAPKAVVVSVASPEAPTPGAFQSDVEHAAEAVIVPGDEGVVLLPDAGIGQPADTGRWATAVMPTSLSPSE